MNTTVIKCFMFLESEIIMCQILNNGKLAIIRSIEQNRCEIGFTNYTDVAQ